MSDILVQTWHLLRQNWILLGPVLIETVIMLIFTSGGGWAGANGVSTLALFFLHQALLGGWLYQMKIVLLQRETKVSFDDFFEGLARYFWPMLNGASVFFLLLMMILLLCSILAESWFGPVDPALLDKFVAPMQNGDLEKVRVIMEQEGERILVFLKWAQVFLGGLTLLGLLAVVTSFWQQYCVMGQMTWIKAWKCSKNLIFKHPAQITYLGLLWLVPSVLLQAMLLSGQAVLQVFALGLDLVTKTYFTLLFCNLVLKLDSENVTPLPTTSVEPPRL
jgi:hypothetical protein